MSSAHQFRLRWKGAVTGPFTLVRIQEMLRAGEISLLHNIEVNGHWTTVRDHFRACGLMRVSSTPVADLAAAPDEASGSVETGFDTAPLTEDRQRNAAGEALERSVRSGYLWCGSTFLLPPVFSLLVVLWTKLVPDTPTLSQFVLFTFMTLIGSFLPLHFVNRVGRQLDLDGLQEIRQAQLRLALVLAFLGMVVWTAVFWVLTHPKP